MKGLLCLVLVVGVTNAINVALKKKTYTSSISHEGQPSRAVDGNDEADYSKNSCTHTGDEKNAIWAVDLGKKYTVNSVSIVNRADCCSDRLKKFEILVVADKPRSKNQAFADSDRCFKQEETFNGEMTFTCAQPIVGRFVVVRFYDDEVRPLTLCEVKVNADVAKGVFCHRPDSDCNQHDILKIPKISLEECQAHCFERDDCVSIQHNYNSDCFIKKHACTDKELIKTDHGDDYIKVDSPDQCPIAFEYCFRANAECQGHTIKSLPGISMSQCKMRCSMTKGCQSIFHKSGQCNLKNFACANFEITGHSQGHDFIKVHDKSECQYLFEIYD